MPRCLPHRQQEPCYYCERGWGRFDSDHEWVSALQMRVKFLEKAIKRIEQAGGTLSLTGAINFKGAVCVKRDFALGDLVMLSPAIQALKKQEPDRPLVFATSPSLFGVLAGADYIDEQVDSFQIEKAEFYKKHEVTFAVEAEGGGKLPLKKYLNKSRPDIFAELLGVPGGAEHFPIPVDPVALAKMRTILYGLKTPIIGLAPTCGSVLRVMPSQYVEPLARQIQEAYGGTVVLVGKTREYNHGLAALQLPGVVNLINTMGVAELIATCFLMDAMISPDTGTMHVAGALGVKCLCVMGNNDPKIFSDFYQSVKTIQPVEIPCVPCHDLGSVARSKGCMPLPKGQSGAACMQAMNPERIMGEFKSFYNGKNVAFLHDVPFPFNGGAELSAKNMIQAGLQLGYNVRRFDATMPTEQLYGLANYDLIVLSNIWRFTPGQMDLIMEAIETTPYVKLEHDFDGLREYPLHITGKYPRQEYASKIYLNSVLNIFMSPGQEQEYRSVFPGLGQTLSLPPTINTNTVAPVKGVQRAPNSALIAVPGKWKPAVIKEFIGNHPDLQVTVLKEKVPYEAWPTLLSGYEYFAHYPDQKWPCDRVIYEAALCGCKIMAGNNVVGLSWGKDLTDLKGLREWLKAVPEQFWKEIAGVLEVINTPIKEVSNG